VYKRTQIKGEKLNMNRYIKTLFSGLSLIINAGLMLAGCDNPTSSSPDNYSQIKGRLEKDFS